MSRYTRIFSLLQSFYWVSACFVYTFAERFLLAYGFSVHQIGMVLASANLASLFLQPLLAELADRENGPSLRSLLFMCLSAAIVFAGILLFPQRSLVLMAVMFACLSTITLAVQPMLNAVGLAYVDRGEPINYSLARGIASAAFALYTYLAGYLAEWRTDALLWCYIAASLGLLLVSLSFAPKKTASSVDVAPVSGTIALLKSHPYLIPFLLGIILTFSMHNYLNAYMLSIVEVIGGGTIEMSIAIALAALFEIPSMAGFSLLERKFRLEPLLLISFSAFVIKHLMLLIPLLIGGGIFWVYLSQCMQLFGYAIFILASSFWVNRQMEEHNKVKGQMLVTEAITVGCIIGQMGGGFLIDHAGVPAATVTGTFFSVAGLVLLSVSLSLKKSSLKKES